MRGGAAWTAAGLALAARKLRLVLEAHARPALPARDADRQPVSGRPALKACSAAFAAALVASPAVAASPFDGTWKIEIPSAKPSTRLELWSISDGVFRCGSCDPPFGVAADGAFHAVGSQPSFDEAAVQVVDLRTVVETHRLKARVVRVETTTLAPDGRTATATFTDTINAGVAPVTGRRVLYRVYAGLAGSHPLSGGWRAQAAEVSANGLTETLKIDGDALSLSTGEGFSYTATLDEAPARTHGDPVADAVSVKRIGERELVETDIHQGQPYASYDMKLSPDGSSLSITLCNRKSGAVSVMTAHKM